MYSSPKHSSPDFIGTLNKIIDSENVSFIHCAPTSEALQVALYGVHCKTLLPNFEVMNLAFDKYNSSLKLARVGIQVPLLYLEEDWGKFQFPLWIRARKGVGGAKSIKCFSMEEVNAWLKIWEKHGVARGDFVFQEFVEGRDLAWDSLWFQGNLVTSFAKERVEYPSRALGRGGSPTVAKTVWDKEANNTGFKAVKALDDKPNGFYCVDMLQNEKGTYVTEVNAGKAHTTLSLWGLAMQRKFNCPNYNLAYVYTRLGLGLKVDGAFPAFDLFPKDYLLVREVDCGSWLVNGKEKLRVDI